MKQLHSYQRILPFKNAERFIFLIFLTIILARPYLIQNYAFLYEDGSDDSTTVAVRITDVNWKLSLLYEEYESLDITINVTLVEFTIEIEIWNFNETDVTIIFRDSDEFPLSIETSLSNNQLELTPYWVSLAVITNRTYSTGVLEKTMTYPFIFSDPTITKLPIGLYLLNLSSPTDTNSNLAINSYGASLTVTPSDYIIEYDEFIDFNDTTTTVTTETTNSVSTEYFQTSESSNSVTTELFLTSGYEIFALFTLLVASLYKKQK